MAFNGNQQQQVSVHYSFILFLYEYIVYIDVLLLFDL